MSHRTIEIDFIYRAITSTLPRRTRDPLQPRHTEAWRTPAKPSQFSTSYLRNDAVPNRDARSLFPDAHHRCHPDTRRRIIVDNATVSRDGPRRPFSSSNDNNSVRSTRLAAADSSKKDAPETKKQASLGFGAVWVVLCWYVSFFFALCAEIRYESTAKRIRWSVAFSRE